MRNYKKNIGLAVVLVVIGYNVYDYFKVKNNIRTDEIARCSAEFRLTNPEIVKSVADEYCSCTYDNLGKYSFSTGKMKSILDNEKAIIQDCYENAVSAKQN